MLYILLLTWYIIASICLACFLLVFWSLLCLLLCQDFDHSWYLKNTLELNTCQSLINHAITPHATYMDIGQVPPSEITFEVVTCKEVEILPRNYFSHKIPYFVFHINLIIIIIVIIYKWNVSNISFILNFRLNIFILKNIWPIPVNRNIYQI